MFKIQRIKLREQEFDELKKDLLEIRKNEIVNYVICTINIISIFLLVYFCIKGFFNKEFYQLNKEFIIGNLIFSLSFSIYLTYQFIKYNIKLKKHIKTSEKAVQYFVDESEKHKNIYENYVDNYLEKQNKNKNNRNY
ncbi:MAG: hypothetical protein JSS94_01470 [Bacteroidetes bacterium]|nr:hypothetical protein [Bacteroidota bacterium]